MKRFFLLTAVLFVALPSSSHAAVVALDVDLGGVFYEAGTGEVNDLQATYSSETFTIIDQGAVIDARDGCSSVSTHEVTCSGTRFASFELGDRNDTGAFLDDQGSPEAQVDILGDEGRDHLTLCSACSGNLLGGGGADTLQGSDGLNYLRGGDGHDAITGARGNDSIYGGHGDDTIVGGRGGDALLPGRGDDTVAGGSGGDTVFFFAPGLTGVTADLRTGVVTGGQGNDTLTSIECLNGSERDDHFWGDSDDECFGGLGGNDVINGRGGADNIHGGCCSGADRLFGGGGRDVIEGGAGDDLIVGGTGVDRLRGNEGDDRLRAKDGVTDRVFGGSGFDKARVDHIDIVRLIEKLVF
jgi:Ca2+-binding RTX toxin-like protein